MRWAIDRIFPVVLSVPLAIQYEDVLFRPASRVDGQSDTDLSLLIDLIFANAEHVRPHFSHRPSLTDPGDELVLEAAVSGNADIITFNVRDFAPASRFGVMVYQPREAVIF